MSLSLVNLGLLTRCGASCGQAVIRCILTKLASAVTASVASRARLWSIESDPERSGGKVDADTFQAHRHPPRDRLPHRRRHDRARRSGAAGKSHHHGHRAAAEAENMSAGSTAAFLAMLSAERGSAKNSLLAYERDIEDYLAFLESR